MENKDLYEGLYITESEKKIVMKLKFDKYHLIFIYIIPFVSSILLIVALLSDNIYVSFLLIGLIVLFLEIMHVQYKVKSMKLTIDLEKKIIIDGKFKVKFDEVNAIYLMVASRMNYHDIFGLLLATKNSENVEQNLILFDRMDRYSDYWKGLGEYLAKYLAEKLDQKIYFTMNATDKRPNVNGDKLVSYWGQSDKLPPYRPF